MSERIRNLSMLRRVKRFVVALALLVACRPEPAIDFEAHTADVAKWKETRDSRLRQKDGWLTLVGLHWLKPGPNPIGSGPADSVSLPSKVGGSLGTLVLEGETVTLQPAAGAALTIDGKPVTEPIQLRDDSHDQGPTLVSSGTVTFQIIRRGDRLGVRVKDAEADTLKQYTGLEYFPIDPKWRVVAKFEPYEPAKKIPITDVTGFITDQTIPGALVFEVDGKTHRLDAIAEEGATQLFVIFRDETSRDVTYPAGRYLYVPRPDAQGNVVVDFNKAYSPPCVFTPFATCPLPPPQNRLPIRIEAGEKNYKQASGLGPQASGK